MAAQGTAMPSRAATNASRRSSSSSENAFTAEDTTEVTKLFGERLAAWRGVVKHLEDYVESTEKLHHSQGKDYEKIVKSVSKPLKTPEQFDQSVGGINGFLDNVRTNTQGISNSHSETAKTLKTGVVPVFSRLDKEIKTKSKELVKGAGKGSKAVDKARQATQKHIEALGQSSAAYESKGGAIKSSDDPYVLQRGVKHRLNKQLIEENANRQDLLAVQNNFASFEAHIVQTIQNGLGQFNTVISKQADITKNLYGDVVANAQRVPAEFEWIKFLERNSATLIDPEAGPRDIANVNFPNQNHRSTQPLIAGTLEKKGKLLRKYESNYYVLTPAKFLHEYKTDDDIAKDPLPELSLFLPDCTVGQCIGEKFAIKGKDSSKGPMGMSLHTSHEFNFKAHTTADALQWWTIIRDAAGQVTSEVPAESTPASPVSQVTSNDEKFGTLPPSASAQAGIGNPVAPEAHPTAASEKAALAANDGHVAAPSATTGTTSGTTTGLTTGTTAGTVGSSVPATTSTGPAPTFAEPPSKF